MRMPLVAAISVVLTAAVAHAEDAVLVSSKVPDYRPGTVIASGQPVKLPEGASAVFLFRSGAMMRIKGPFGRALPEQTESANSVVALVQELRTAGADASVLGASRSVSVTTARAAMDGRRVVIEPYRSGIYCIGQHDSVWLRRASNTEDLLKVRSGNNVREIKWTGDEMEWPSDIMIEDSDSFETLNKSGNATIIFRRLGNEPSETAWLAENLLLGCHEQAEPALRELVGTVGRND
jgi:hypothetical protein